MISNGFGAKAKLLTDFRKWNLKSLVLKGLNKILGNFNITKQFTDSRGDIAYLLADVSDVSLDQIRDIYSEISEMPTNIKTRLLCE